MSWPVGQRRERIWIQAGLNVEAVTQECCSRTEMQ